MSRSSVAVVREMPAFTLPTKLESPIAADRQSAENSQTLEAYGEYAISQNILIIAKHLFQNTHLENDTRRTIYHELGCKRQCHFQPLVFCRREVCALCGLLFRR